MPTVKVGDLLLEFLQGVNMLIPLLDEHLIHLVGPLSAPDAVWDLLEGKIITGARQACLWGCLSIAASMRCDWGAANECLVQFRHLLGDFYAEETTDAIAAHALMSLVWYLRDDLPRCRSSLRFAMELSRDMGAFSPELRASLKLLLAMSSSDEHSTPVALPSLEAGMGLSLPLQYAEGFSWAMIHFHERMRQQGCWTTTSKGRRNPRPPDQQQPATCEEIEVALVPLLQAMETNWPSEIHVLTLRLLLGLVQVTKGAYVDGMKTFEPIPQLLQNCPGFLKLPFVWNLCHSASLVSYSLGATQIFYPMRQCMASVETWLPFVPRTCISPSLALDGNTGVVGAAMVSPLLVGSNCSHYVCSFAAKVAACFLAGGAGVPSLKSPSSTCSPKGPVCGQSRKRARVSETSCLPVAAASTSPAEPLRAAFLATKRDNNVAPDAESHLAWLDDEALMSMLLDGGLDGDSFDSEWLSTGPNLSLPSAVPSC
jgi:hypothetical protein